MIDPARDVAIWTWDLAGEAFGNSAAAEDPDGDGLPFTFSMRFPGQRYDVSSGLNYNYFRDYDPRTGRYVESDPIGLLAGTSTYGYVQGGPLTGKDVFGLARSSLDNAIEAAIKRGDIVELETILEAGMPNPAQVATIRQAIARLGSRASDIIAKECKGSINREFPSQLREHTLKQITEMAKRGDAVARKALKLLNDLRFKK